MIDNMLSFMQGMGLSAANTFSPDRRPTWEPWGQNRFRTRALAKVLDYVLVDRRWDVEGIMVQQVYHRGDRQIEVGWQIMQWCSVQCDNQVSDLALGPSSALLGNLLWWDGRH